jgi:predicted amidohydrolase
MVRQAANAGCRFVVLPEVMDLGWDEPSALAHAQPVPGPRTQAIAAMARENNIYIVTGLTERAGDSVFNAAVLVSPQGELLHHHRKINVLPECEGFYDIGDRLGVARTLEATIGMDICADSFSKVNTHALARMGANLILSPCAWAVEPGHDNQRTPYGQSWIDVYGQITRLYGITIIGVSNVGHVVSGAWKGWRCIGCSVAVGPGGEVLARGPYGHAAQTLLTVDVPITKPPARGNDWHPYLAKIGYKGD